jgi:hypothetical protein
MRRGKKGVEMKRRAGAVKGSSPLLLNYYHFDVDSKSLAGKRYRFPLTPLSF